MPSPDMEITCEPTRIVHPKTKHFPHPHVIFCRSFFLQWNTKCLFFFLSIQPKSIGTPLIFNQFSKYLLLCCTEEKKKVKQVWNDISMSKWWQNVLFYLCKDNDLILEHLTYDNPLIFQMSPLFYNSLLKTNFDHSNNILNQGKMIHCHDQLDYSHFSVVSQYWQTNHFSSQSEHIL